MTAEQPHTEPQPRAATDLPGETLPSWAIDEINKTRHEILEGEVTGYQNMESVNQMFLALPDEVQVDLADIAAVERDGKHHVKFRYKAGGALVVGLAAAASGIVRFRSKSKS